MERKWKKSRKVIRQKANRKEEIEQEIDIQQATTTGEETELKEEFQKALEVGDYPGTLNLRIIDASNCERKDILQTVKIATFTQDGAELFEIEDCESILHNNMQIILPGKIKIHHRFSLLCKFGLGFQSAIQASFYYNYTRTRVSSFPNK